MLNDAESEKAAYQAQVRIDYEAEKTRILAADYPFNLTFLFNDAAVMRDFAAYLSDGGGEYGFTDAAYDEGLSVHFDYFGKTKTFLGEGVVRVNSSPAEDEEAQNAE